MKTVLKGKEWVSYMDARSLSEKKQEDIYVCTHHHNAIYKIGDYFFSFAIKQGYKNLTALKRLL